MSMLPVYCQHFGLTREPFSVTPDPSFLYLTDSHDEALSQLVYGIKARRGFVVLTGEVGTGKTTLIHRLLEEIKGNTKTAYVFNMIFSPKDLFRYICEKFGIIGTVERGQDIHDYLNLLERFLLESNETNKNVALIIDEAQNLGTEVLENIRLLSNFEKSHEKLLQILLVGQPELKTHLNAPALRQLKQRIALRHHLRPLSVVECKNYIAKRLEVAGSARPLFTRDALVAVSEYSNGIPRLINVLCDNGLLAAYASCRPVVDYGLIDEVARSLELVVVREQSLTSNEILEELNSTKQLSRTRESQQSLRHGTAGEAEQTGNGKKTDLLVNGNLLTETAESNPVNGQKPSVSPKGQLERNFVPSLFFEQMIGALTEAMGPMARFVVRENIADMGESQKAFPKARLQQLIERVSREILLESLRLNFQRTVQAEIREIEPNS